MTPTLSVCIPTHHGRRDELAAALASFTAQASAAAPDVEICITDNASQDGTQQMVADFARDHPQLVVAYSRNPENLGLAPNIFRSVEMAHGEWCWLFGSDDTAIDGSVAHLLDVARAHPYAAGIAAKKLNVSPDLSQRYLLDEPAFFPDASTLSVYRGFAAALDQMGLQPCYLSSNVVRRELWVQALERHRQMALAHPVWPQVIAMIEMLRTTPVWVWTPEPVVNARAWTTFVSDRNAAAMMAANFRGLHAVYAALLGARTPEYHRLTDRLRRAWATSDAVAGIKADPGVPLRDELRLLTAAARAFWGTRGFWTDALPTLLVPGAWTRARAAWNARRAASVGLSPEQCATRIEVCLSPDVHRRDMLRLPARLTNLGPVALRSTPPVPVGVGYRWISAATGDVVLEQYAAMLPAPLTPGAGLDLTLSVFTPWDAGRYRLCVAPVQHEVARFEDLDPANGWSAAVEVTRATASP